MKDLKEQDGLILVEKSLDEFISEQDKDENDNTEEELYDEDIGYFPSLWDRR